MRFDARLGAAPIPRRHIEDALTLGTAERSREIIDSPRELQCVLKRHVNVVWVRQSITVDFKVLDDVRIFSFEPLRQPNEDERKSLF